MANPAVLSGTIIDGSAQFAVSIQTTDGSSIDPSRPTWLIIHGWNSSPAVFTDLVNAIHSQRPTDQILVLDWQTAANTGPLDPVSAENRIPLVATWAATTLKTAGFSGTNLNEIGHSFGAYIADEIAELIPGGVNTIVALDPAVNVAGTYNPEGAGGVNFAQYSQFAWAFHDSDPANLGTSDGLGSPITPVTADEAFDVGNSNHSQIRDLFTFFLTHPDDPTGQYFTLQRLLDHQAGPWMPNQYNASGALSAGGGYEALITATGGGVIPQSIAFSQPALIVESSGSTNLTQIGNNFYFYNSAGVGPSFNFGGSPYTAGAFGAWIPIGVEQIAGGGYDLAWMVPGADQYTVWTTDSNGNYVSALFGTVSGSNSALRSIETTFHQDLNHDGVIGIPTLQAVIESSGSTTLTEVGNYFYLYDSNSTGPSFNYGGHPFYAGQFGGWVPIGAEQIAGGDYNLAWRYANTDQYTVWSLDSSGNYVSVLLGVVSGSNSTLESIESTFHQDLNSDGVIGVPGGSPVTIESSGSTSLTQVGSNFYFYDSSNVGPSFNFGGSPFTSGSFGAWKPVGAEQVAGGGYYLAWEVPGADQYTVWTTDSNGNYVSALFGTVSGSSSALRSIETTFHQDLNHDGAIGIPSGSTIIESSGSTTLTEVGNYFYLYDSNSTGPSFNYGGHPFYAGQFGGWVPIGAEKIAGGGYYLAFRYADTDQYTVWSLDSSGNYVSVLLGVVSSSNSALKSSESTFHQDLNSDGVIGVPGSASVTVVSGPSLPPSGIETESTAHSLQDRSAENFDFLIQDLSHPANSGGSVAQFANLSTFVPQTDPSQRGHALLADIENLFGTMHDLNNGAVTVDVANEIVTILNGNTAELHSYLSNFHLV